MKRVLNDEAYAIDVAYTGEEARTLALVHDYDGIILDLNLWRPARTGSVAGATASRTAYTDLLYSGKGDSETIVRGLDAGATISW